VDGPRLRSVAIAGSNFSADVFGCIQSLFDFSFEEYLDEILELASDPFGEQVGAKNPCESWRDCGRIFHGVSLQKLAASTAGL
jgi:hypothetical protein